MIRNVPPFIILIFLINGGVFAIENPRAGARAVALSDAFISFSGNWATFHNQAGLVFCQSISASVFYSSKFGLKELSQKTAALVYPTKSGVLGLGYSQFGSEQYKEAKIGLSFAKRLSQKLSSGIQLDYFSISLPENKHSPGFITFEFGILYKSSKKVAFGAHVFNPVKQGIITSESNIKLPVILRTGANYKLSGTLLLCIELESNGKNHLLKAGTEFIPIENLAIRFGVSGKPFAYTSGIGYKVGNISTDIGFSYHGNLGFTPSVSLQFYMP